MTTATALKDILDIVKSPIAIGFLDSPPEGVSQWEGAPVPAGCAFWKEAMKGRTFYTVHADHYNCAVGSYTHGIQLPPDRAHELNDTIGFMAESNYVAMSEVPGIPALAKSPAFIAYGPLEEAAFSADIVLIAVKPAQAMLIYEAALKSGAGSALTNSLGRPACAVLPLTVNSGQASVSLGCKGNRTFTGLPDEEMYLAVPADKWDGVVEKLKETQQANETMGEYYSSRQAQFAAS